MQPQIISSYSLPSSSSHIQPSSSSSSPTGVKSIIPVNSKPLVESKIKIGIRAVSNLCVLPAISVALSIAEVFSFMAFELFNLPSSSKSAITSPLVRPVNLAISSAFSNDACISGDVSAM